MNEGSTPGWEPSHLEAADLRTPVTPALRRLPRKERDDLLARRAARDERFDPFSPKQRRQFLERALPAAAGFVVVTLLFTPFGIFDAPWLLAPFAFVFGAGVAWHRPGPTLCAAWMILVGAVLLQLSGHAVLSFFGTLAVFFYGAFGMAIGMSTRLAASDGD